MIKIQHNAAHLIDSIYRYSKSTHGDEYAYTYLKGLFSSFVGVGDSKTKSLPIPEAYDVSGFYYYYENHIVYWKYLKSGDMGIVTILPKHLH